MKIKERQERKGENATSRVSSREFYEILPSLFLFRLSLVATLVHSRLEARDISDTSRICECCGSAPWGWRTETDRRTFNERAALETRIDVTLDYLNGTDPDTMVSLLLMFYPSTERHSRACRTEGDFFNKRAIANSNKDFFCPRFVTKIKDY